MKNRIISIVILTLFMFTMLAPSVFAAETVTSVYVAPDGKDSAAGTIDSPLATLDGARKRVKELKEQGITSIEVVFRGGDYYTAPVRFTEADSGTAENPIVYRAYEGETPNFKASALLDASKFTPVTDEAALKRIQPSVRNKIGVLDLKAQGISQGDLLDTSVDFFTSYAMGGSGKGDYNSIYVNDVEMDLAQWPNGREYTTWTGTLNANTITYDGSAPERWVNADNYWLFMYNGYDFSITRVSPVKVDPVEKSIQVDSRCTVNNPFSKRWKAFNLLEELDVPGEFYIDRDTMLLYMYPPHTLVDAKVEMSIYGGTMVSLEYAKNITFKDLAFSQSRSVAVLGTEIDNVDFLNCTFKDIGDKAIRFTSTRKVVTGNSYWQNAYGQADSSYNCDVKGCYFDNIGSSALFISGGNCDTLTPSNNIIEDNVVVRANMRYVIDSAVAFAGCGNTFRRNVVTKSNQHGIHMFGNNHVVEDNEFSDVLREVADAGVIYMGRNQLHRGNVIQRNLLHNIDPKDSKLISGTCGIYMDDGHQGNTIINNFIIGVRGNGYNSNQGAAMTFANNIIANTRKAWAFHQNQDGEIWDKTMMGTLEDMISDIYDKELYFKAYPDLKTWYETKAQPRIYSKIHNNLLVNCESTVIGSMEQKYASIENNIILDSTDAFADPANIDYRLKADSDLAAQLPDSLNTENYDIEQNGTINDRTFNEENSSFRLRYPENLSTVSSIGLELLWQDAGPANQYRLEVATDVEFKNKVIDKIVYFNNYVPTEIGPNTRYYWRVTAQNTTRDLKCEWPHDGAVYSFMTSIYTPLETTSTLSAIENATLSSTTAVEGDYPGSYKIGSIANINNYIALTKELMNLRTGRYSQAALDVRTNYILNYFKNKSLINKGFVNLFDYAEPKYWLESMTSVNANEITQNKSGGTGGTLGLSHLSGSVIYCFDVEMNITEGGFSGIGINLVPGNQLYTGANRGYFLCVKDGLIELQKTNGSTNEILETKYVDVVDGKKHPIRWGVLNTSTGNLVYANIDGEVVFEYMDVTSTAPTSLSLGFALTVSTNKDSYTRFYPSANIPGNEEFEAIVQRAEILAAKAVMEAFPEDFTFVSNIKDKANVILTDEGIFDVSYATPELVDDNMMVPANVLPKIMGIEATEDGSTLTLSKEGVTSVFTEGSGTYTHMGAAKTSRYAPYRKNGYLMVSILDIMDAFDYEQTEDWLNNMAIVSKSGAFNVVNDSIFISTVVDVIDGVHPYMGGKDVYFADIK